MRENSREADLRPQLEGFVQRVRHETGVPGLAVAVCRGGERLVAVAGSCSADRTEPLGAAARYHVGCITKLLLAMLVHELAAEGALALAAPVGEYLPELRGAPLGERVRVAHLLAHTSGYRGTHVLDRSLDDWQSLVAYLRGTPLLFEPGTVFSYEHTESLLLAAIVERTTGHASLALLRERLLTPLGIAPGRLGELDATTDAGRHHFDPRSARFAVVPRPDVPSSLWLPAFSDYTMTLAELATVADAAVGRDPQALLSPPTLRALETSVVPLPTVAGGPLRDFLPVAFGPGTAEFGDGFRGNTGVSTGQCVGLRFDPRTGTTVVAALNAAVPPLRDFVLGTVSAELAGRPRTHAPVPFALDFTALEGAYIGPGDACAEVRVERDKLVCALGRAATDERLRAELARGAAGELVLRSPLPQLSLGFFRDPAAQRIVLMVGLSAYRRLPL